MKCPKCHYLGFETGNRCKNCGYDFSLLTLADASVPSDDLVLRSSADRDVPSSAGAWDDIEIDPLRLELAAPEPQAAPAVANDVSTPPRDGETRLPLFQHPATHEDEPLIKAPAAPRPPLAVRKTPDVPRLRTIIAPPLRGDASAPIPSPDRPAPASPSSGFAPRERIASRGRVDACGAAPRALAAGIDIAVLLAIDLAVVYFTLRMVGLAGSGWRELPPLPLLAFLTLLKFAYYAVFTAFGGQTIGKMAAHIRVVAEDDSYLDPAQAVRRTLAGVASVLTLGAGFAPALVGPGGRAFHDRVAHTRVVAIPSA